MTSETDTDTEEKKPFGDRLAEARKLLGLTAEELSNTLNLDIKLLEALERSDIEQLPPATYVQGYIKAYTKALGISSEDIHADYLKSIDDSKNVELQPRSPLPIETTSETPIVKTFSIFFAVLAISALLFMVYSYYSDKVDRVDYSIADNEVDNMGQLALPLEKEVVELQIETPDEKQLSLDEGQTEESLLTVVDGSESDEVGDAAGDAATGAAIEAAVIDEVQSPSVQLEPEPDLEVPVETVDETVVIEQPDELMIRAVTESWAEIRDDNKVRIYYGMLQPDDLRVLKGKAPFDVFLGNALNVDIAVNGFDVDMSDYIRANNVARFKVSEKSSQIVFH